MLSEFINKDKIESKEAIFVNELSSNNCQKKVFIRDS